MGEGHELNSLPPSASLACNGHYPAPFGKSCQCRVVEHGYLYPKSDRQIIWKKIRTLNTHELTEFQRGATHL